MWKFGGLSWREVLRLLWRRLWRDKLLDQAAMLSFYFILSIFPLLLFLVALLGLMLQSGQSVHAALHSYLSKLAPASASGLIDKTLLQIRRGSSSGKLSLGLLISLYMASSGMVAVMDSLNVAYEVRETRTWWRQRLVALTLTIGSALFMATALILLSFGNHLASIASDDVGVHTQLLMTGWTVLKWLLVLGFVLMAFNLLYISAPNVKHRRWHWLMPGTALGVILWLLVSYGFKLYLSFFNQFNLTYGSIATVIILLTWFYFTGLAILLGGELNSVIEKKTRRVKKRHANDSRARSFPQRISGLHLVRRRSPHR